MKTAKKIPITGTNIEVSKRKPFVPNAKDTSLAAQTEIASAPSPFTDRMNTPQMPVGTGSRGAVPGQEPKRLYAGKSGKSAGHMALPGGAAIGQGKMPNQSGQVNGRMGTSFPKRKGRTVSVPSKKRSSFYGE